jgi:hypothetical protein
MGEGRRGERCCPTSGGVPRAQRPANSSGAGGSLGPGYRPGCLLYRRFGGPVTGRAGRPARRCLQGEARSGDRSSAAPGPNQLTRGRRSRSEGGAHSTWPLVAALTRWSTTSCRQFYPHLAQGGPCTGRTVRGRWLGERLGQLLAGQEVLDRGAELDGVWPVDGRASGRVMPAAEPSARLGVRSASNTGSCPSPALFAGSRLRGGPRLCSDMAVTAAMVFGLVRAGVTAVIGCEAARPGRVVPAAQLAVTARRSGCSPRLLV